MSEDPIRDGANWYVYASNNPLNRIDPTGMVDVFYDGSVGFDPNDSNIYFIPHYNQYKDSSWIDDIGSKVLLFESDNMDYSVALSMAGFDVSKINEKAILAAKKLIESKGYTWKDGKYKKNGILGKLFNKAFLGEAAGHDKTGSLFYHVMTDVYELISEVKNTPENREQAAGNFTQYAVTASSFSFYSQTGSNTQNQKPVQTRPFRGDARNIENSSPLKIPSNAKVIQQTKTGYSQIKFKWTRGKFKYEARWHTPTPNAPAGTGNN